LGKLLSDKYAGSYLNLINESNGSAQSLLTIIINDLPSFKDTSKYKKSDIYFYKRAQLLVSDVNHCLLKKGLTGLEGISTLTACADYKLPQMLRKFGVIIYSDSLADKIDSMIEIDEGSDEEIEIRCATIVAVERIVETYQSEGYKTTAMNVNDDLWILSQTLSANSEPYHRTLTTNY
jgi:uncharacterized protein YqgQ